MNKEEIESTRLFLLNIGTPLSKTDEILDFLVINNILEKAELKSQLNKSNNKIEKIKEIINKRLKHNEDYIKTESEDANLLYILSIIDGSDE